MKLTGIEGGFVADGGNVFPLEFPEFLGLYIFSQSKDPYETYNEFTVLAESKEKAWKLIENRMKNSEEDWIDDFSTYEIDEYSLSDPVVIPHYSHG